MNGFLLQDSSDKTEVVYAHVLSGNSRKAVRVVFDWLDDLALSGRFEVIGQILCQVDLDRIDETTMIGFASITLPAKNFIPERELFLNRVKKHISKTRQDAESLLQGLE